MAKFFWIYVVAGVLGILITTILQPIWSVAQSYWAYTYYTMLFIGVGLIIVAGILAMIRKLKSLKIFFGIVGFAMVLLFLYLAVPWFSISII